MDIIQVIIFIIIIVAAIVQQISKTGKEKKTPSPKKVLADIFPEIEQENIEEDLPVSSVQTVRTPQTPRMQHQPMVKKPTDSPRKENKREDRTPIRLSTKEEARTCLLFIQRFLIANINNNYTNKNNTLNIMGFNIIPQPKQPAISSMATTLDSAALLRQEHRKP